MPRLTFIVPCHNAAPNLPDLIASLRCQADPGWRAVLIDDLSTDGTGDVLSAAAAEDDRLSCIINDERRFALQNIVEASTRVEGVVAVIDGDDQLVNDGTVSLVKGSHVRPGMVVWTAHRWDINDLNISREMPQRVDPYSHPWCTSHLRTFDASILRRVPTPNFRDHLGRWFERGYDQALMLPLLRLADVRLYVPEVCYLYRIKSCSIPDRSWTERKQLQTVNFVRARGFLDG